MDPSILLDPNSNDPDGRGDRRVPADSTFVVRMPKAFYDDHRFRDLIAGNVELERTRHYDVRMDGVIADELISDAECYLEYARQGALDYPNIGMEASAKAMIKAIQKQRP